LVVPPVAIAVTFLAWRGGLPDRIASQSSDLGASDGALPVVGVFLTALIAAVVAMIAGLVLLCVRRMDPRVVRGSMFWLGMVQGIAAMIWIVPAWGTYRAGSMEEAVLGPWMLLPVACTLYGVVPYALHPRPVPPAASLIKPMSLSATETGVWAQTISSTVFGWVSVFMVALTAAILALTVVSGEPGAAIFGAVVMLMATVAVVSFVRLRVTVDWRGLRVVSWLLGVTLKRIPLERIRTVESTQLHPGEWGGWGYRVMPGRSAVILRSGPGLVVATTDGKQFAITLDAPETPASLLAGLARTKTATSLGGTT